MTALIVNVNPLAKLTDEAFHQLCQANRDLRFERTAQGELIVMSPTGGETGNRNFKLYGPFLTWDPQEQLGYFFDSSTAFRLPNGAIRSLDIAWVCRDRWNALTPEQRQAFPPLCPDFVLELRFSYGDATRTISDSLKSLQDKIQEYLDNGTRLGWLINPKEKQVEIYRPGQVLEAIAVPATLSGEDVLPDFVVNISQLLP